jgi:hypothetical protein
MALTNYGDMKQAILDEWERIQDDPYLGDTLGEIADGYLPVYYSEIIQEWQELPMEYTDQWQDLASENDSTICGLMTIDLYNYYRDLASRAYSELSQDKEQDNA